MSKKTYGQKAVSLTASFLVGTGLVLSLAQPLGHDAVAGKSLAELRQEAWTQTIFSGHAPAMRSAQPISSAFVQSADPIVTGSLSPAPELAETFTPHGAVIHISEITKNDLQEDDPAARSGAQRVVAQIDSEILVDRSSKGDRRQGWSWEPFRVEHGRKAIALNWSGSVWSMDSPFCKPRQTDTSRNWPLRRARRPIS